MATARWIGRAEPVAQITSVTAGGTISGETFEISVGGVVIASVTDVTGSANTVRDDLVDAWNNSTHVYATGITAAAAGTGQVNLTADNAGVPFVITLNTPGGSATFNQASVTASSGPHHADTAANWSTGSVPGAGDTIELMDTDVPILWGLDAFDSVTVTKFYMESTYTGQIGLPKDVFTVTNGSTDDSASEYRDTYLTFDGLTDARIGVKFNGQAGGPSLAKIDCGSSAATDVRIFSTASLAVANQPAVHILTNNSSAAVRVHDGSVGWGIAEAGDSGEASLFRQTGASAKSRIGDGMTLADLEIYTGECSAANTPTNIITGEAATLRMTGSGAITSVESNAAIDWSAGGYTVTSEIAR